MKLTRPLTLALLLTAALCRGQDDLEAPYGNGWYLATNSFPYVTERGPNAPQGPGADPIPLVPGNPNALAETSTPEIVALARGLQNDPKLIFDFVHDHIRYVHYFGAHKGAQLTFLERSGNAFDQCALLVALLRAAGLNATYQFGVTSFPYASPDQQDYQHWVGATMPNTNWNVTLALLGQIHGQRGFPFNNIFTGDTNHYAFHHVWVRLSWNGTDYFLDPSFKVSQPITGIDLDAAMGLDTNALMSAAGGTNTADYVQGLNEAALRSKLQLYATNLLSTIKSSYSNTAVEDIAGGQQIVSSVSQPLSQPLAFTIQTNGGAWPVSEWQYIPTNLMAVLRVMVQGVTNIFYTPGLGGDRLSLTFSASGLAQLWQQDNQVLSLQTTGSLSTISVTQNVQHPYGAWNFSGTNILQRSSTWDMNVIMDSQRTNASYVILYAFEAAAPWLAERQQQLDAYRQQGYSDTSRQVQTETLNVMGLNWLVQTELTEQLLARQQNVLSHWHHRLGRMAQEKGKGYYVDVAGQLNGDTPAGGTNAVDAQSPFQVFQLEGYLASALEHGIIEQLQASNLVAASTVKILQLANTNSQRIYLANSSNWTSGASVSTHLINYNVSFLYNAYIGQGYSMLLSSNGHVQIAGSGSWTGSGYVVLQILPNIKSIGMIIGGAYNGGYISDPSAIPSPTAIAQISYSQPTYFAAQSPLLSVPMQLGADPVNMADGTFRIAHTDLTAGQPAPRGLNFSRSYSSSRRNSNLAGMAGGWLHNYYCKASEISAAQAGLGAGSAPQMASTLVATRALLRIYNSSQPDPKNWMVTALIAKWAVDQLSKNGISISLGEDTIQFVKQPDGAFTAPANCTMTLLKTNSAYWLQERHGNTFKFNSLGWLTNIVDQYSQGLILTYQASNWVSTIKDWKGRTLNFTYSGTPQRLTSVALTNGPSISLGYSTAYSPQGDLASVTDPEGKTSTFIYDTNHQVTATLNALNQLVTSNLFDGFNRVTTQFSQGDTNKAWQIFWSPFETVEQDPAGGRRTFFYDDKHRLIAQQDALGNASQTAYDDQDHVIATLSPMNETNQFIYDGNHNLLYAIDPLGFTNQFVYDALFNLIQTLDARGNSTRFGYNAKFQLIGSTNGAGDWVTFTYNSSDGTLNTRVDPGGTTTYSYDNWGQLNGVTYPGSLGGEGYLNNALGDVLSRTNARNFVTSFQYNSRRQPTNAVAPTNLTARIGVDAVGNVLSTTDARGFTSSNTWSATRKLLATILPSTPQGVPLITNIYERRDWLSGTLNPLQQAIVFVNDVAGRLASLTDPVSRTVNYGYDLDGRRTSTTNAASEVAGQQWSARSEAIKSTDPASNFVSRVFDPAGNQIILTNRNGKRWQFQFDAANRLTNTITPLNHQTKTAFNNRGLPQLVTAPSGNTNSLLYDPKGRLTNRTDQVGTTAFKYDANNNLTNVVENGQTLQRQYDAYDRLTSYRDADGNLIQYRMDANGNVTNLIYPDGKIVKYFYDNLNRLTNVTDWASRKTSFTWDLANRLTSITRPNGTKRIINYDAAGETTNIVEQTGSGGPIAFFKLDWNSAARMDWEFSGPLPHAYTPASRTMTFDDDNRLATFNGSGVTIDLDGNLTYGPVTNSAFSSYTYDARNQLLAVGGLNYGYDPTGNRTSITNGTNITRFVINPGAALSQVLVRVKSGVTNYYVYGLGLLYEVDDAGNTKTYHYDYRGSTIALTDGSGLVTDRVEYSLYGATTYRGGTSDTPFLYNGRYGVMTDANGLLCMRARYYNPYLCRFINPDPSGFSGGLNFYAYADGNPVSLIDPFGLGATEGWGGATATWLQRNVVDPLNSVSTTSTLANYYTYNAASFIGGMADMLRLGQGSSEAIDANNGWDVAIGITKDVGRAAGISLIVGGGLEGFVERPGGTAPPTTYCFAADTKVSTPNGDVNIQDIKAGDSVYAYDFEGHKVMEETVEKTHQNFTYHWVEIEVNGETIVATRSHPFWVESERRWFKAADLETGMELRLRSGETAAISSVKVKDLEQPETTYNFEVSHQHDYFVGDIHVLVHNGDGSYTITFSSGKTYSGKGDAMRAADSAARISAQTGDAVVKTDWMPANGTADSFVQEEMRLRAAGGPGGNTYNQINSPGNKIVAASGCP